MFSKKKFTGDEVIRHLYKHGIASPDILLYPLLKKFFPHKIDVLTALSIKGVLRDLKTTEFIHVRGYESLGNETDGELSDIDNVEIYARLRKDGYEYWRKREPRWWTKQIIGWIGGFIVGLAVGITYNIAEQVTEQFDKQQNQPMEQSKKYSVPFVEDSFHLTPELSAKDSCQ